MNSKRIVRTYSELIQYSIFEERFEYLRLYGRVGEDTFGFDRYLNQLLYTSPEWRATRHRIITRDNGCDLGIPELEIIDQKIVIHHMNPISKEDVLNKSKFLFDPEYLICTVDSTHRSIHYGNSDNIYKGPIIRTKNDTCPWRH